MDRIKKAIVIAVILIISTIFLSFFLSYLYKLLFTPRIIFGAKGFTEYSPGDNGRVFIQLLDNFFSPVSNAVCNIRAYYPNNTLFFSGIMTYFEKGLYYFDFIAPETLGVYMTLVECSYPQEKVSYFPDNTNLWYIDNTVVSASSLTLDFPNITEDYRSYFEAYFRSIPTAGVNIYILNRCNNVYELIERATVNRPQVSNDFELTCRNPPRFLMNSTAKFGIDMFSITTYRNATSMVANLRGGGEIHIKLVKGEFTPSENIPSIHILS